MASSPDHHNRGTDQDDSQSQSAAPPSTNPLPLHHVPSFDGADRVFPIRSVVSLGTTPSSSSAQAQTQPQPSHPSSPTGDSARGFPVVDESIAERMPSPRTPPTAGHDDSASANVGGDPSLIAGDDVAQSRPEDISHGFLTSRFEHVVTEQGHGVSTGKPGEFQACEDEPIRIPGAVQSFGVLLAFRDEGNEKLAVRIVSENSKDLLGYSPNELFALDSFLDILKDDYADTLLDHIDLVRDGTFDPIVDGPDVFLLSVSQPNRKSRRFWVAIHLCPSDRDLVICEFELEDDQVNPLNVSGRDTPTTPSATLGVEPTPEQIAASTRSLSQPLRILRNARRRKGEAAAMEVFSILTQIQNQLSRTDTLDSLLNTATGLVKELTGFHRVLIYQFDMNWNGTTVAELLDPRASKDIYKGLQFPASDIPKQARELYKVNKVRLLYDRDQVTARLVCRTPQDLETPLDMTHAFLRAMSPVHMKYLANMDVRASMSISINGFNDLWGLISCHSYGESGMRVSFPIRRMCRLIGDTVSRNIERLSYASRLHARRLINTSPTDANPSGYIIASSEDLLKLFDADYGALCIRNETKILGNPSSSQEVLALLEYLKMRQINSVIASHNIKKDFQDLQYAPGFQQISGLLYVPLSTGGHDFIAFFRRGHLTEIKWAGNPYDKKIVDGHLEPRKSFQVWRETVLDQSREWTETDVETAAVLCLVYGKFISVWRQKEAAMENSQLTRLLLANSAHEVRTPLNAIINYLEIAMEGALDTETRDNLTKSHSASKSLIYVINDLLDLTNAEKGQNLIKDEPFDFPQTVKEAADLFDSEVQRKGITFDVNMQPGIPRKVLGDQRRIRQVLSNLISNAVRHTSDGGVTVEYWRAIKQPDNGDAVVEMAVLDTGSGMSQSTLEALFQQLEQVDSFDNSDGQDLLPPLESEEEHRVLGLGLALVARIVRNMQGQLSVRSEEGKGSRFKISLQFPLPDGMSEVTGDNDTRPANQAVPGSTFPQREEKEFMLVDGNAPAREPERRRSAESMRSGKSSKSGRSGSSSQTRRREADRLISAMQESPLVRSTSEGSKIPQSKSSMGLSERPSPPRSSNSLSLSGQPLQEFNGESHVPKEVPLVEVPQEEVPRETKDEMPESLPPSTETAPAEMKAEIPKSFRVLVAEDDKINSKIIEKRLQKLGHTVHLTCDGEQCATAYREDPSKYDIVLMDIQMPVVDGIECTRMIRAFESETSPSLSPTAQVNHAQIPIFAVSASLFEKDAPMFMQTGFDGWIMKPIDFNRLVVLMEGSWKDDIKGQLAYQPGQWVNGGWFRGAS